MTHAIHPRRCRTPVALLALALAGGCASLDPGPDIGRARATVAERAGVAPEWSEPWEAALTSWDGRSPLRVEQAVAMALRNNREIRSEVEAIAASRADLVQAGLLPNPVLQFTLRFPFDPVSGGTFVGAQVVQSFAALWLRDGKIRAADARLNQTVLDVSDKALALVAEVRASHARIVFGQRAVAMIDENLATMRRTIDSFEARVRAGEGIALDVNRARQRLAGAETEREIARRDLAQERRRMLELIGFAAEHEAWEAHPDPSAGPMPTPDEPGVIALAASQRLDVAAARCVAEARRDELTVEERSRLRDFGVGADFERSESGEKSVGPVIEIGVPIFDTNEAQIAKAGSLARAALATYEAVAQRAVREARVAWVATDSAARLVEQRRASLVAVAEHNLALARGALDAGDADITAVLETQRELVDARRTINDLERDAALARIALEHAVGGRLEAPAPTAGDAPVQRGRVHSAGSVSWVGEMHRTVMEGDTAARVRLAGLLTTPGLCAVGPAEGLNGEITAIDGSLHLGLADGVVTRSSPRADAGAPFLVWAHVLEWTRRPLPPECATSSALETALPALVRDAGLDPEAPVPFRIEGTARSLSYHVLRPVPGLAPGREAHDRAQVRAAIADQPVRLIGFYSPGHRGVFTPGFSDVHTHFVSADESLSGHVEAFVLDPGATLLLPLPANP